jgi:hypothetical protein
MDSLEIRATKDSIIDFMQSVLWMDICQELNSWRRGFEMERGSIVDDAAENNPSTASVLLHLGDLNGRIKAVDYMLSIPEVFLSIIESKEEK